ncbi:MAG: tRNA A-37 threonylcarbamoyl transferase component Bud32, partial [Planctomycetota bacterium]
DTPFARAPLPDIGPLHALFPELEIYEAIGRGGSGVVYRARQTRLDRLVALKILDDELSRDDAFAGRFLREARALARLNHPAIVGVHDFGDREGCFYLMMEYVDGVSLRDRLEAKDLDAGDVLEIIPEICQGLQYAHEAGVVHRDIKPENLLLTAEGRVKIADFGLAKMIELGGPALTRRTQVMGTPHYMAPEQVNRPLEVDHRADIYSLGVVLYEMLTTELPIGRFVPPSEVAGGSDRFDPVVLKALEREPLARYQKVSDISSDIAGFDSSEDGAPHPATGSGSAAEPELAPADNQDTDSSREDSNAGLAANQAWLAAVGYSPKVIATAALLLAWVWIAILLKLPTDVAWHSLQEVYILIHGDEWGSLSTQWLAAAYPLAYLAYWIAQGLDPQQRNTRLLKNVAFISCAAIVMRLCMFEDHRPAALIVEGLAAISVVFSHLCLERWIRKGDRMSILGAVLLMAQATVMHSSAVAHPSREAYYHASGTMSILGLSAALVLLPNIFLGSRNRGTNGALIRASSVVLISAAFYFHKQLF